MVGRFAGTLPFLLTIPRFDEVYSRGRKLGEGAFAEVFECKRLATGEEFAVKIFKRGCALPRAVAWGRAVREAGRGARTWVLGVTWPPQEAAAEGRPRGHDVQ